MSLADFMRLLKGNREKLTRQQFSTIRGQAISGNIEGAKKGLDRVLRRRCRG